MNFALNGPSKRFSLRVKHICWFAFFETHFFIRKHKTIFTNNKGGKFLKKLSVVLRLWESITG